MEMQMDFIRQLPTPAELKEEFPVSERVTAIKEERDAELADIFEGRSDKLCLLIGPCSADREDAVLEYMVRLAGLYEKVKDKVFIVPRVYTNKPRTVGLGYKGMLHQPDPEKGEDMLEGIIAIRQLHADIANETGFTCADEMLYPANHRYLSDLLSYVAIGARSSEDQEHRIVASGIGVPCGLKNPTSGDLSVMINSIVAAQNRHKFLYRGWEVQSQGNPHAHAILRGRVDKFGHNHPNYYYEDLLTVGRLYEESGAVNPAIIVDTNHANSGKQYNEQIRIAKDVLHSARYDSAVRDLVKGFMVESYLVDGSQPVGGGVYGQSITDPCLGWEKTERLVLDLAEQW
ncbi:MAG: 3-deoxy-7-phosphoheptulonate synthase [Clostridia bacterium]|nr:3-deoxy-7-phosphoheptulonate synthase [Clostridia bacterium]